MKRIVAVFLAVIMILGVCPTVFAEGDKITYIELSSVKDGDGYVHSAKVDGVEVPEYDYVWNVDPTVAHDEVKNSPAEYYTGTKPSGEDAVYIAHDIYYYPILDESKFVKANYDGEQEWIYLYEAEGYENFIFSTLPVLKTGFPSQMMHSAEEAYQNAVLHITKAGVYSINGEWHGQIRVEIDDAFDDPSQKVTLILNGVNVECTVASGVVFADVYECDNLWEEREDYGYQVDTSNAGATVKIADGTVNNVSGTNIFRILKTQYKDDDSTDKYPAQKKRFKVDGAFYSYQSLNINGGDGVLNITSGFEGLNSELHLTVNGGNVNIYSQDDGINVNEDGVSVFAVNGGNLHICAGLGAEGDGVDSNGFLVINGGTVISAANPAADSGLDSDCGSYVFGGNVVSLGSAMDWAESDDATEGQAVINLRFAGSQDSGEAIVITDTDGKTVFAYDPDKDEVLGSKIRTYSGAILSAETLNVGGKYYVYVGGDVSGNEVTGVYDISTVTDFSGGTQQCVSGTMNVGGRPDMNRGEMPDGVTPDGWGAMSPDRWGGQTPDGEPATPPDWDTASRPEKPDGFSGRFSGGFMGNGQMQTGATCTLPKEFELTKRVNAFSVADVRHEFVGDALGVTKCSVCGATPSGDVSVDSSHIITSQPSDNASPKVSGSVVLNFVLSGVCIALAVVVIVLVFKKKKV